jgi:hypothetical protein
MSGRVISGWRDGKPIRGFRKTARVVVKHRGPQPWQLPAWRARFIVKDNIAWALGIGRVDGFISCCISKIGSYVVAEVAGKDRAWVLRQADALADALGQQERPLFVRIERDGQPSFTISGPLSRGDDGVVEIGYGGKIIDGSVMRELRPRRGNA